MKINIYLFIAILYICIIHNFLLRLKEIKMKTVLWPPIGPRHYT